MLERLMQEFIDTGIIFLCMLEHTDRTGPGVKQPGVAHHEVYTTVSGTVINEY